jgi:hypothetical protein
LSNFSKCDDRLAPRWVAAFQLAVTVQTVLYLWVVMMAGLLLRQSPQPVAG